MAIAKVIEISSTSNKSFDDAVENGIERASKTIQNIQGAWVKEMKIKVEGSKVIEYRVNMAVTFVVK